MARTENQRSSHRDKPMDDGPIERPQSESNPERDDPEGEVDLAEAYRMDNPHDPIVQFMSWFSWTKFRS